MAQDQQQVTDALFFGNLDPRVTKRILYDICIQVKVVQRLAFAMHPCCCKVALTHTLAGWACILNKLTRNQR